MNSPLPQTGTAQLLTLLDPYVPDAFINEHWNRRPKRGPHRSLSASETVFRYAIRPHTVYDQTAATHFGLESTEPFIAAPGAGPAPASSLVEISSGPIMITSLKPSSDGKALLLRLYNTGQSTARASLKWNSLTPKAISVSDLLEEIGVPASDTVDLPAYEVRTLRAELK